MVVLDPPGRVNKINKAHAREVGTSGNAVANAGLSNFDTAGSASSGGGGGGPPLEPKFDEYGRIIGWKQGEDFEDFDNPMSLEDFNEKFGTDYDFRIGDEDKGKDADKETLSEGDNTNTGGGLDGGTTNLSDSGGGEDPAANFENGEEAETDANDHAEGEASKGKEGKGPEWHHEGRDARNSDLPESPEQAEKEGWRRVSRNKYHDNGIGNPEVKYVHPDGREAIYDGDTGELIDEGDLKGTYNYINPGDWSANPFSWRRAAESDFGHIVVDVIPYKIWGN